MKKIFITTMLVLITGVTHAQTVITDEPAIIYYMPKTLIVLEATCTQHTLEAGPFAEFATEMLGATDYIPTNAVYYELNNIVTATRTLPDYSRAYKLTADDALNTQYIRLDHNGVLQGYNLPRNNSNKGTTPKEETAAQVTAPTLSKPMPILEDMFGVDDRRQQAESIARQIMRIRETRIYVLSGEVEHAPADGHAMQQVLEELNKQEQEMTELFIGRHSVCQKTCKWVYNPSETRTDTIGYFSTTTGLSQQPTTDALPVEIDIECIRQEQTPAEEPEKGIQKLFNKAPKASQLYYNLPGYANYTVQFNGQVMAQRQLPIAQFGVALPLAQQLFKQKKQPVIVLDSKTGNLVEIRQ